MRTLQCSSSLLLNCMYIIIELIARCKRISTARSSGDTPMHKVCRSGKIVSDILGYNTIVVYAIVTTCHITCIS